MASITWFIQHRVKRGLTCFQFNAFETSFITKKREPKTLKASKIEQFMREKTFTSEIETKLVRVIPVSK